MTAYFMLHDVPVADEGTHLHCTLIAAATQDAPRPGVMIFPDGIRIAGGDGMPMVEPFLSVGTASTAQPKPPVPSVQ